MNSRTRIETKSDKRHPGLTKSAQELRRSFLFRKNRVWWILPIILFILVGCTSNKAANKATGNVKAPTELIVKSVKVDKGPKLNADGNDEVWKNAPAANISTRGGPDAVIRSVYTKDSVYFLVTWKDTTPQTGVLWWEYDGQKWTRNYDTDDKIGFIWNMNNSIPGFDKLGCSAICHKDSKGKDWMIVTGQRTEEGPWPGIGYMADAWKWAPGIMNEKNTVDDGLFSAPKEARQRPETTNMVTLSLVFDGGDEGTKQWFTRNPNAATAEEKAQGVVKPAYTPRPGYDLSKNPFPNMKDMVPITDYSIFNAGDKLPMMVYFDLTNEKNKEDFPEGRPSGSRMDIVGRGVWSDNKYTLEFGRKLDTKHGDDVQFKPDPDKPVAVNVFGLALFNDTRFNHTISSPVTLILEP